MAKPGENSALSPGSQAARVFITPAVARHCQGFINYLQFEKRYSPNTIIAYETDLRDFFDYLAVTYGGMDLKEISHTFIRSWLALLMGEGIGAKSINRKISTLRSFFKYQLKMGVVEVTPLTKVISPKTGKRLPVFMKEQETSNLMRSLASSTEDWKTLNAKMLLSLFYTTGMRLSELINLREKQVDLDRLQVKVLGKGNKERVIPVSKEMVNNIREYLQAKKKVFASTPDVLLVTEKGKKVYPKYAYLLVNEYLKESAPTLEKKSPHILRHTFATHLMNSGADLNAVKELLGHSSLASTQVYTHNTIDKLKEVYKNAHPKA